MNNLKQIIAKNISELRIGSNMTQLALAESLNYSDKAISKWERGESIPDIAVLKEIADLFEVTLDYLVEESHEAKVQSSFKKKTRKYNHGFITGISVLLVWLCATLGFVITDILADTNKHWLTFIYAVPVSMIVWVIMNSLWFNKRRNFFIISLLVWSTLISFYLTFLAFNISVWQVLILGVPAQIIILLWSRIKRTKPE